MIGLRTAFLAIGVMLLTACTGGETPPAKMMERSQTAGWPPMKLFPPAVKRIGVRRSNQDLAGDFLDLMFRLESGPEIPVFSRFEGPVTIAFAGPVRKSLSYDLDQLVVRLRREAGVDIRRVKTGQPAQIVVDAIPGRTLYRQVPGAACFVVPNVASWDAYLQNRFRGTTDWLKVNERRQVLVVLPDDVAPQEARDCLHEEIAQGLGPLNDLYHLADSVYNDDNFQLILSPFDMLMLKVAYDPSLKSGMTKDQVAARLPAILNRVNPAGRGLASRGKKRVLPGFKRRIETALGPRSSRQARLTAANQAVALARRDGSNDHRLGFALYARARVELAHNPKQSLKDFSQAAVLFSKNPGPTSSHYAHAAIQLATLWMVEGRLELATQMIDQLIPIAKSSENALLLFQLYILKSEIVLAQGNADQSRKLVENAIAWGRYGYGSDEQIAHHMKEAQGLIRDREFQSLEGS